ncbi:hypothetical protein HU200_002900 [Digitaria exilis]|uniref:Uncharacterized protein n=1 Tax=Digitaria exilis TaxID=1010633 RepID=A0A835FYT1_9POAL|nr:hypothetical protein HU200_002900 [Digitaria exilis]
MAFSALRAPAGVGRILPSPLRIIRSMATSALRSTTVVMGAESGHHIFRIKGYSQAKEIPNGQYMTLGTMDVGGHSWILHYYPNGKTSADTGFISLFLFRDGELCTSNGMPAKYKFTVLGLDGKPVPSFSSNSTSFKTEGFNVHSYGYPKFMKLAELEKSECLKDDSFAVQCDVIVAAVEDTSEGLAAAPPPAAITAPPKSDLQKDLAELLWKKDGTDVTIDVGKETFSAHKWLMAARSPVFKEKFFGSSTQRRTAMNHIQIDDMEPQVFKSLLHFMYTDTLPKMDEEALSAMATGLLAAADRFKLESLKKICEEMLCKRVDMSTIESCLVLSERHRCPALQAACMKFLDSPGNLKAIMAKEDGFEMAKKNCPTLLLEFFIKLWLERSTGEPKTTRG